MTTSKTGHETSVNQRENDIANDQIENVLLCIDQWHASDHRGDRGFSGMVEALMADVDWEVVSVDAIKQALRAICTGSPADELAAMSAKATSERRAIQDRHRSAGG